MLGALLTRYVCCKSYIFDGSILQKIDHFGYMTVTASEIELKRFTFYRELNYVRMLFDAWLSYCRYFAGLLEARLMSDDMVVYMVHLWGSTFTHFVYEYDGETDEPVRVIGIVDDLSSWSNDQSVEEMWDGATFEILSVFIDYDADCRCPRRGVGL